MDSLSQSTINNQQSKMLQTYKPDSVPRIATGQLSFIWDENLSSPLSAHPPTHRRY